MKKSFAAVVIVVAVICGLVVTGCRQKDQVAGTQPPAASKVPEKQFIEARGLHVTGWIAGGRKSFGKLIDLCNKTELNALCIDIKDSDGIITYEVDVPLAKQIKATRRAIGNIDRVMKTMSDSDVYPIARIAVFKDPILAGGKPSLAIHKNTGGIWLDRTRSGWANPYHKAVWDYNIDIAIDAAKHGFKEIQWDYVRFPSDGPVSKAVYPGKDKRKDYEVVRDFLGYARERLKPYGVVMSADIFGLTSITSHNLGIGQSLAMIAENVDYICPMVYPSHYARYEYGIPNPNTAPYQTIRLSLGDHVEHLEGTKAKVRPWLQDFSLYGVHYGKNQILAQRKAAAEMGIKEFLLWNPRCVYTTDSLARDGDNPPKEITSALNSRPFRLVVKKSGPNKDKVQTLIATTTGPAKAAILIKRLPNPVANQLSWSEAEKLKVQYKALGATADIR